MCAERCGRGPFGRASSRARRRSVVGGASWAWPLQRSLSTEPPWHWRWSVGDDAHWWRSVLPGESAAEPCRVGVGASATERPRRRAGSGASLATAECVRGGATVGGASSTDAPRQRLLGGATVVEWSQAMAAARMRLLVQEAASIHGRGFGRTMIACNGFISHLSREFPPMTLWEWEISHDPVGREGTDSYESASQQSATPLLHNTYYYTVIFYNVYFFSEHSFSHNIPLLIPTSTATKIPHPFCTIQITIR